MSAPTASSPHWPRRTVSAASRRIIFRSAAQLKLHATHAMRLQDDTTPAVLWLTQTDPAAYRQQGKSAGGYHDREKQTAVSRRPGRQPVAHGAGERGARQAREGPDHRGGSQSGRG